MNKLLFILLFALPAMAQEREMFIGRVVSGNAGVAGVYVINKTAGTETRTDNAGNFRILASAGDALSIYSPKIVVREFRLSRQMFGSQPEPYIITVSYQAYELEGVVIDKPVITSESLGLVPKNQKRYTPAERRLYTATSGGIFMIDPIINAITGRTRMLKRALETEKLEFAQDAINGMYNEDEIAELCRIPPKHVSGFVFFLAERPAFVAAVKAGNKDIADFMIADLALEYLKRISDEK